jgi:uncharacterized protein (TIGR02246 family)
MFAGSGLSILESPSPMEACFMRSAKRYARVLPLGICLVFAFGAPQYARADALEDLAKRVQVLEDREAIRELILAYGAAHDGRDYRTFASLFARDGEWVGGFGSAKGPAAIFQLMDETVGHNPLPEGSGTFHVMANDRIRIDGDRASAVTKWIYIAPGADDAPRMVFLGHYNDEFVREDGEWKFLRREAPLDIPAAP